MNLGSAWGWAKDKLGDAKELGEAAIDWGADQAGALWDWASTSAGDSFPFLGFGGGGSSRGPAAQVPGGATNVYCGGGPSGPCSAVDQRRYVIEGDFLLDTYQGRVWKYDSSSGTFARVIRELSETELDAVEGAHGIFEYMRTKLGDRMKTEAEDRSAPLVHVFDLAAKSAKRDLAAHRHALAIRSTKTKRR